MKSVAFHLSPAFFQPGVDEYSGQRLCEIHRLALRSKLSGYVVLFCDQLRFVMAKKGNIPTKSRHLRIVSEVYLQMRTEAASTRYNTKKLE
jgi:hypothetical protein